MQVIFLRIGTLGDHAVRLVLDGGVLGLGVVGRFQDVLGLDDIRGRWSLVTGGIIRSDNVEYNVLGSGYLDIPTARSISIESKKPPKP